MRTFLTLLILPMLSANAAPFLVAHRGASGDAPENTLPAFELAWQQNADAIEGDFHLTRDGKIVCFHDRDTKKLTGKKLVIAESTLAELQALDVGAWRGEKFAGTRMPTLAQVLASVPARKKIYIEIKCGPQIVPGLLADVKKSKLQDDQIVVISFDPAVIAEVRRQQPAWVANLLHSFNKRQAEAPGKELPAVLETLARIKAHGLGTNSHPDLTPAHLAQLRKAGFQHHVWTVDDAETARRFLDMECASVTTNYPGRIRKNLSKSD